ncbi:hypothetical protein EPA93_22430 [Ktedonosporobacter rubrisoli]|uniref:Uncharacterized protein n=1 Tax=Ktedonosporobacter rubrisoli TaxID=2509675 RepID=A0A4P6JSS1_KTERU|nr:hypothetical protein [Ktedonosporobacter rubrisoli]QBD78599.1 hypothetical protein EPA93_22430 [Ktedonosporobacter rubrisoli]
MTVCEKIVKISKYLLYFLAGIVSGGGKHYCVECGGRTLEAGGFVQLRAGVRPAFAHRKNGPVGPFVIYSTWTMLI